VRDVMRTGDGAEGARSYRARRAVPVDEAHGHDVDDVQRVKGIFTDGDLRRVLERSGDFRGLPIAS
jgi:arabinose-5-phosphate isomerase